jgi:hypothetical protein
MPIKPDRKKLYPPDWKEIRARILARAQNKCEECGVDNYAIGARDENNIWSNLNEIDNMNCDCGEALWGDYPNIIRIVLTISHTCHDESCTDENHLRALCQRCHNRYDAPHRQRNARLTRMSKKAVANLFGESVYTV